MPGFCFQSKNQQSRDFSWEEDITSIYIILDKYPYKKMKIVTMKVEIIIV